MSEIEREARFLIERLRQFESENIGQSAFRDWNGHVSPSIARLELLLEAARQARESETFLDFAEKVIEAAVKEAMPGPCNPPDDPPPGYQEYCEGVASVRGYIDRLRAAGCSNGQDCPHCEPGNGCGNGH